MEEFDNIFREKGIPDQIPVFGLHWDEESLWLPQILKTSGLVKSTGEAMRLIKQGAISIDEQKVGDPDIKITKGNYLIKAGKRKFLRIQPKETL